jgi:phenylacetate-CoA ligase
MVLTTLKKQARPMIRFRTGDIVTATTTPCPCGRTSVRFTVIGRLDDMFIVSGVNVFPSDIEFVVRGVAGLNGEYRITVLEENHLSKFDLEVERENGNQAADRALAERVTHETKTRLGVRPRTVTVQPPGTLPRATHKAKRLVDLRGAARQGA